VPVLMMFGRAGFPSRPTSPIRSESWSASTAAWKAALEQQDPSLKDVFALIPAWQPVKATPFQFPQMNEDGDPPNTWQLIAAGWGFVLFDPASVQADDGAGLAPRHHWPGEQGAAAQAGRLGRAARLGVGRGRGLDYLETDPAVDAKHVGIDGVSRYGKAALVTMAFDQRFAMVLVGSSGKGGATLLRRNFGEAVESLTGRRILLDGRQLPEIWRLRSDVWEQDSGRPSGRFQRTDCALRAAAHLYQLRHSGKGRRQVAGPRRQLHGDGGCEPRLHLLGAKGLDVEGDYRTAKMPPVNEGLLDGQLAWRQHDGGHTDAPNMKWFLLWADKFIGHAPPQTRPSQARA
jgi:hypothetical protein